jgi:DNA polymerase-4
MERAMNNAIPADSTSRVIFHIDMDAFFASIEQRDTPEYRGKPLIVGARPGMRGVVCAASYEARRFGVRSALPISEAVRRCPGGVFVQPRMDVYSEESRMVMRILDSFSPRIEPVSIDEAFLDMSGTTRLFGPPRKAAEAIYKRILGERGLTASIGIAPNKYLAKIASDLNKPRGITEAPFNAADIRAWLAPMPVERVWGVGKKTAEQFERIGIRTIGDLQTRSKHYLAQRFGKNGAGLYELSHGVDDRPVGGEGTAKSISREHTFNTDSPDRSEWQKVLFDLSQDVARHAREQGVRGATVVLTWRSSDFFRHSKRTTLSCPTDLAKFIFKEACTLLQDILEPKLRLIGVGITGLESEFQLDLFEQEEKSNALEISERAADMIVKRFGQDAIVKGSELPARKGGGKKGARNRPDRSP